MAASTVPAAKQAILNLLTARPNLVDVAITWGEPTEQEDYPADEVMYFQDPVERFPEWSTIGGPNSPLQETYTITLVVKNRTVGDDRAATEARTWELVDEVEQAVRADLRLGSVLFKPLEFGEQAVITAALSDGWFGEASLPFVCTARI